MADGSAMVVAQAAESESQGKSAGGRLVVRKLPKHKKEKPREFSTIQFPYQDLENAIGVARAMIDNGGGKFTREQLAGVMKLSPTSGNFVLKLGASKMFGLTESDNGKHELTQLGYSIVEKDEARERAARVQAFLTVPLFRKIYDEFRNKQLPPRPHGLEAAIVKLGVIANRKADARLTFDKSATQAGFFSLGQDRLIEPLVGAPVSTERTRTSDEQPSARANTEVQQAAPSASKVDPLIKGLLDRLPTPGEKWPTEKRFRWLQTLAANLDFVYLTEDGDKAIIIEMKQL